MKKIFISLALTMVLSFTAFAQGVVREFVGDVRVSNGKGPAVAVTNNMQIVNGATVTTGEKSTVIIRFTDGTVVALEQNTSFQVQKYNYDEKQPSAMTALFSMTRGAMRALTGVIGQKNRDAVRVATPNATIGIRGTDFMIAFNVITQTTTTGVISGSIAVTAANTVVVTIGGASITVGVTPSTLAALTSIPAGTFGTLTTIQLQAIAATLQAAGASTAAAGAVTPVAAGAAAAAAAAAAAIGGNENNSTGTITGTVTGTVK